MSDRERILTPRAQAPAVRDALLRIQCSIISSDPFNPAQADRRFRIILSDFVTLVLFLKRSWSALHAKYPPSASKCFLSMTAPMSSSGAVTSILSLFRNGTCRARIQD